MNFIELTKFAPMPDKLIVSLQSINYIEDCGECGSRIYFSNNSYIDVTESYSKIKSYIHHMVKYSSYAHFYTLNGEED